MLTKKKLMKLPAVSQIFIGGTVSLILLAVVQPACLSQDAPINETTRKNRHVIMPTEVGGTTEVSDSFAKEEDETKRQIEQSPDEDDIKSALPASGRVLTTQQKRSIGSDATVIVNDISGTKSTKRRIPAKTTAGTATVALALGGGGARGAAHVGVLRVFEQEGLPVDYIVGNSMGSIVGGLYCAGLSLDEITSHLQDRSLRKAFMPGGLAQKVVFLPLSKLIHPFRPKHYAGLWTGEKLTKYLENVLPRPNMEVEDTKIPFSAVATNLIDGKAYRITKGRLSTAIKASAAIPPIIQPVALDDKVLVDGGVRANLPASAAKDTGAGLVIAVLVDEPMQILPAKQFLHLKNIAARMSDIVLAIADERQLQFADVVINPNVSGIPILSNDPDDVKKAIHAGELAARKALPELRKRLSLQVPKGASSPN